MSSRSAHSTTESPAHSPVHDPVDLFDGGSTAGQRWTFFAVVSLGLLMIGLDNSILYTALPELSAQLGASETEQLWIINAYVLVLAGLLLGTGTLGDKIGHRRMFILGLSVFGLASLAAAFAPTPVLLIAARALLGFGAATMMPATLALIRLTFADEQERNTAIGIWGSVAVVGAAAGPVVGGILLEHFWWGSIFLINVPIVILALILTWRIAPANLPNPAKQWDISSSFLALMTLVGLTLVIKQSAAGAWTQVAIAALVTVVGSWLFLRRQQQLTDPLLTLDIFRSRLFSGGVLAAAGAMFVLAGVELSTTQKLQLANGFSPLHAGLVVAAAAVTAIPFSALGGAILHRVGFLPLISGGFGLIAAGIFCAYSATDPSTAAVTMPLFLLGMVLAGAGAGSVMSVSSTAIIGAAPVHRTGMAAGVEEVSYEFGTLLAIALTGSLLPVFYDFFAAVPADSHYEPGAYTQAYSLTLVVLGTVTVALIASTAWAFIHNPKSGLAHASDQ